jgi:protease I
MNAAGKSIVAIGHAPQLLVAAGLVAGRVVTGDASVADAVRNAGGQWGDPAVVEDRNGISSRGPEDLAELNRHLLLLLAARTYRHSAGSRRRAKGEALKARRRERRGSTERRSGRDRR